MKQQLINNACMMFASAFKDINLETVRNILTVALEDCEVVKYTKAVTVYEGEQNDKLLKAFLVAKKVAGLSDKSIERYGYIVNQFLKKVGKQAYDVTSNDVLVYLAHREISDGVSDVTRKGERAVLCSFFSWMHDEELIDTNPMRRVATVKTRKAVKKAFTSLELEKIRANCKNEKEAALVEILISTGCRVSELCSIRLSDMDNECITVHGKGNKDRICYLTARAQLAVYEYMQSEYFKKRRELGSSFLFMSKRLANQEYLKPIKPHSVELLVKQIGKRADVEDCHPHRFRRTCATMALERGMPIEQVSRMLGHESISTTQIYLDLTEDSLKAAHKKYVN